MAIFREVKNRNGEAEALLNLSQVYAILKNKDKLLEYVQQSLQIFRETKNQQGEAAALGSLGFAYSSAKPDEAADYFNQALSLSQLVKDRRTEAQVLRGLGRASRRLSKDQDATNYYKQALLIAQQIRDLSLESRILQDLGHSSKALSKYYEAVSYFSQSLAISRKIKIPNQEATALGELGIVNMFLLKPKEAIINLEQAQYIFKRIKLYSDECLATRYLGNIYLNSNDLEKAEEYYKKAIKIAADHEYSEEEYFAWSSLLSIYVEQNSYKVFEIPDRYLSLARKISPKVEAEAMADLAIKYVLIDFNMSKIIEISQQALQKIQTVDVTRIPKEKLNIVRIHQKILARLVYGLTGLGEYEEAARRNQERLFLIRSVQNSDKNIDSEIDALIQQSKIHIAKQEWLLANAVLEEASALVPNLKELRIGQKSAVKIDILNTFVTLHTQQGNAPKALEEAKKAVALAEQTSRPKLKLTALKSLRTAYAEQNDFSELLVILNQQINLSRQLDNSIDRSMALGELGQFYIDLGDYKTSRSVLEEARAEAQEGKIPLMEFAIQTMLTYQDILEGDPKSALQLEKIVAQQASFPILHQMSYWLISQAHGELGNEQKSIEAAQKSLALTRKTKNRWAERSVLILLGDLYRKFGHYQDAISIYNQALVSVDKRQDLGTNNQIVKIYAGLAKTYVALDQPIIAIAFYKQSVYGVEKTRTHLRPLSQNLQQSFLQSTIDFGKVKTADIYRDLADLLLQQNRILEARQVIELLKLQELDDYSKDTRGKVASLSFLKAETALLNAFNAQQKSLIQTMQELAALRLKPTSERTAQETQRLRALDNLEIQADADMRAFIDSPKVKALIGELKDTDKMIPLTGDDIVNLQSNLKTLRTSQQEAAIIYPFVLDDRLEILIITADAPPLRRTVLNVDRAKLNAAILEFSTRIASPSEDAKPSAQALYKMLIAPIENDLTQAKINTLLYSPDRRLRSIPLGALHDGDQWLAQRFQITYITASENTISDLVTKRDEPPKILAGSIADDDKTTYRVDLLNAQYPFQGLPAGKSEGCGSSEATQLGC